MKKVLLVTSDFRYLVVNEDCIPDGYLPEYDIITIDGLLVYVKDHMSYSDAMRAIMKYNCTVVLPAEFQKFDEPEITIHYPNGPELKQKWGIVISSDPKLSGHVFPIESPIVPLDLSFGCDGKSTSVCKVAEYGGWVVYSAPRPPTTTLATTKDFAMVVELLEIIKAKQGTK